MSLRCPTWLAADLVSAMQDDITDLLADGRASDTITYQRYTAGTTPTVNEDTGVLTDPYTATEDVPAFVGHWKAHELAQWPVLQAGDLRCLFRKASVSGALTTSDRVAWNSQTYEVRMIKRWKPGSGSSDVDVVVVGMRLIGGAGG